MDERDARNRRRSERVVLKVPLIVRIETRVGKHANEHAQTLAVNAHGGLLTAHLSVTAGQTIVLANPRTGAEEVCRVIRAESLEGEKVAIAFEFQHPAPHFWPVAFPPRDWETVEV